MLGEMKLFFKNHKEDEYETCVICKCKTNVKKDKPIKERYSYVEGTGQLCYECYKKLYKQI